MREVARSVTDFGGRHTWKVFLAVGLLYVWFGGSDLSEAVTRSSRVAAMSLLVIGVLTTAISVTALRRGERWAWVTMLIWPVFNVSYVVFAEGWAGVEPLAVVVWLVILALPVVALLISAPAYLTGGPPHERPDPELEGTGR